MCRQSGPLGATGGHCGWTGSWESTAGGRGRAPSGRRRSPAPERWGPRGALCPAGAGTPENPEPWSAVCPLASRGPAWHQLLAQGAHLGRGLGRPGPARTVLFVDWGQGVLEAQERPAAPESGGLNPTRGWGGRRQRPGPLRAGEAPEGGAWSWPGKANGILEKLELPACPQGGVGIGAVSQQSSPPVRSGPPLALGT